MKIQIFRIKRDVTKLLGESYQDEYHMDDILLSWDVKIDDEYARLRMWTDMGELWLRSFENAGQHWKGARLITLEEVKKLVADGKLKPERNKGR